MEVPEFVCWVTVGRVTARAGEGVLVANWTWPTTVLTVLDTVVLVGWVEPGAVDSWMFVETCIGPTMVTGWDTTVVLGTTGAPGTWKIGLINTGLVVRNCGGRGVGVCWRISCGLIFLFGRTIVATMPGGAWDVGAEETGLEVTNTVI